MGIVTIDPDIDSDGSSYAGDDLNAFFADPITGANGTKPNRKIFEPPVQHARYKIGTPTGLDWTNKNFWLLRPNSSIVGSTLTLDHSLPTGHRKIPGVYWTQGTRTLRSITPQFSAADVSPQRALVANGLGAQGGSSGTAFYGWETRSYVSPTEITIGPRHDSGQTIATTVLPASGGRELHLASDNGGRVTWATLNWFGGSYLQVRNVHFIGILPAGAAGQYHGQPWEEDVAVTINGVTGLAEIAYCTIENLGSEFAIGRTNGGTRSRGIWIHHNDQVGAARKAGRQFFSFQNSDDVAVEDNTGCVSPRAFIDVEHGSVNRLAVLRNDVTFHGLLFFANGNDYPLTDFEVAFNRDWTATGTNLETQLNTKSTIASGPPKRRRRIWIHHNERMGTGGVNEQFFIHDADAVLIEDNDVPSTSKWAKVESSVMVRCCTNVVSRNNDLGAYPYQLHELTEEDRGVILEPNGPSSTLNVVFDPNHGYAVGNRVRFRAGDDALPGALNRTVGYWIVNVSSVNRFQVSGTSGGTPIVFPDIRSVTCGRLTCTPLSDQTPTAFTVNPPAIDRVYANGATGGPQHVVLGLAGETDRAWTVFPRAPIGGPGVTGVPFTMGMSQVGGSDLIGGGTIPITLTLGLAYESNQAFDFDEIRHVVSLGLAYEADAAFAPVVKKTIALLRARELDHVFPLLGAHESLGLAYEADSALAVAIRKAVALALATEDDTAFAVATGHDVDLNTSRTRNVALPVRAFNREIINAGGVDVL